MYDTRYIVWKAKHDEQVRKNFINVTGAHLPQVTKFSKWSHKQMVGTRALSPDNEKKLKDFLGKRIEIKRKEPSFLWSN